MTFRPLVLPLSSFLAAALIGRFSPASLIPAGVPGLTASTPVSSGIGKFETDPSSSTPTGPRTAQATPSPDGTSHATPTLEDVFAATGVDRMLLMARFIQTASGEELRAVIERADEDKIYEIAFTDQAWLRWVEVDLEAALKYPRVGNAWWAYAKLNPQAAFTRASETDRTKLPGVLRSIGQSDPSLARKLLAEHPGIDQNLVLGGIFEGLAKVDPGAATALALEKGGSYLEEQFNNWMRQDPEGALAWMRDLKNPAERRRVGDLAMAQLIAKDPAAGLKEARKLAPGLSQTTHTVEAISALAKQDPAAARAAAEALPSPYARQKALAALAVSLASQSDPSLTETLVSSLDWKLLTNSRRLEWSYRPADGKGISRGYTEDNASDMIVTQLISAAPKVTSDALAGLVTSQDPNNVSPETADLLANAVQKWATVLPEVASSWLKDQPPGAARDQGIVGLTQWLTSGSPEPDYSAALAWVGAASAERQFELYRKTVLSWESTDPQAAAAAVETLPIPSEQRDLLRLSLTSNSSGSKDPFAK